MWHRFAAWWRGWRYHWSPVTRLEPVRVGEGDPRFGSMSLEDERRITLPRLGGHLRVWGSGHTCDSAGPHEGNCVCECGMPAPYDTAPDWREQTMAELSPEALEHPQGPQAAVSWGAGPGPGAGSSSAPGPDIPAPLPEADTAVTGDAEGWGEYRPLSLGIPIRRYICPDPGHERLADTGEIASARQLAEWDADLRAQDDDAARYLAGLGFECERYRLEMAEAWA